MPTATLTSQGQVTVPKPIRDHLHLEQGDKVDFSALAGLLYHPHRKTVSLEDMDHAIAGAVIGKAGTLP